MNPFPGDRRQAARDTSRGAVTILMPAYNEEDIIADAVTEWYAEVVTKLPDARLLIIDDCSTDGTEAALVQLGKTIPGLEHLRCRVNGGHGQALLSGVRHLQTGIVLPNDTD